MAAALLFLEYPKCSTCQKAKKWLEENHVTFTARHIVEQNPQYEELKNWWQLSGLPLKKFFNTSGLKYKSLDLKNKLPAMTEDEQLRLLASDGMLVKRPLLASDKAVIPGFNPETWKKLISTAAE